MTLTKLTVKGLSGFATEQTIEFAVPNGEPGSGITVVVGPNSGGKSTLLESIRAACSTQNSTSFAEGRRNQAAGDCVSIAWTIDGNHRVLRSAQQGSSQTVRDGPHLEGVLHLPSRRSFNPYFGKSEENRAGYAQSGVAQTRSQPVDSFAYRLQALLKSGNRQKFDGLLEELVGSKLDWTIDESDQGQSYVRVNTGDAKHTSDGLGEGIINLMFMVDALHDSEAGGVIVVDEPELSLHPIYQRRLRAMFSRFAADRQIVLATHSPYFVDWKDIARGGSIHRIYRKPDAGCTIASPDRPCLEAMAAFTTDLHNPHVVGINASEVLFLEDGVILAEGQEDVIVYQAFVEQLNATPGGTFFGWGVGGADKMPTVVRLLSQLGFTKVFGILDANKQAVTDQLGAAYPEFKFVAISENDVKDKNARNAMPAVTGLADSHGALKAEHVQEVEALLETTKAYFAP